MAAGEAKSTSKTEYLSDYYDSPYDDWENFLVYNTGKNVSPNFNFMLRVEGLFDLPCRKVRAFTKANEYEYIQEGGLNDYVHMRRKPVSQPFTFQVERYVGVDYIDPLQPGTDLILPIVLFVCRMEMKNNFMPFRTYTFTGCTVMSKEYGELNAEQSGLHTEITTIGYRELVRVTLPDGVLEGIANAAHRFDFEMGEDEHGNKYLKNSGRHGSARKPDNDSTHPEGRLYMHNMTGYKENQLLTSKLPVSGTEVKTRLMNSAETPVDNPEDRPQPVSWLGDKNGYTDGQEVVFKSSVKPETEYKVKHSKSANQTNNSATAKTPEVWLGNENKYAEGQKVEYKSADGKTVEKTYIHKSRAQHQENEKDKKDRTNPSVLWEGIQEGKPTSTKPVRANFPKKNQDKNAERAAVRGWGFKGFILGPKGKKVPARTSAVHPKYDRVRARAVEWRGIRPGSVNTINVRANVPKYDKKRAKKVLWEGIKEGKPVNTESKRANFTPKSKAKAKEKAISNKVIWEGLKEGQPPKTENKRANHTRTSQKKAKEKAIDEKILWEGLKEGQPASTANARAKTPKNDSARAPQELWTGISSGSTANTRAVSPANNSARAEQTLWEGIATGSTENARAISPLNNSDRAEGALWEGISTGSTANTRARVPANNSDRAEKVLWEGVRSGERPKNLRAFMANALK